jgi:hypothetical protein
VPSPTGLAWHCRIFFSVLGRYTPTLWNPKKPLANQFRRDSSRCLIRVGFVDPASRSDLIDLGRHGSVAHRLARRANALVLLDDQMSCGEVAKVLLLDDDTVRIWHRLYKDEGIEGLASFGYDGSTSARMAAPSIVALYRTRAGSGAAASATEDQLTPPTATQDLLGWCSDSKMTPLLVVTHLRIDFSGVGHRPFLENGSRPRPTGRQPRP